MFEKFEINFSIFVSIIVLAMLAAVMAARVASSDPALYPFVDDRVEIAQ